MGKSVSGSPEPRTQKGSVRTKCLYGIDMWTQACAKFTPLIVFKRSQYLYCVLLNTNASVKIFF